MFIIYRMKDQAEIFEGTQTINKKEIKELEETDTITEMPDAIPEKFVKQRKKRAPLSDEQKERLKLQLAKGRATSLANRQKKATLKKIEKEEKITEQEDKIFKAIEKKKNSSKDQSNLLNEIDELKRKLAEKEQPQAPAETPQKPKKERKPKQIKKPITPPSSPEPEPEPEPEPQPEPQPTMSNRNLAKMMRGLR